jgi:hypothetical protein
MGGAANVLLQLLPLTNNKALFKEIQVPAMREDTMLTLKNIHIKYLHMCKCKSSGMF